MTGNLKKVIERISAVGGSRDDEALTFFNDTLLNQEYLSFVTSLATTILENKQSA